MSVRVCVCVCVCVVVVVVAEPDRSEFENPRLFRSDPLRLVFQSKTIAIIRKMPRQLVCLRLEGTGTAMRDR